MKIATKLLLQQLTDLDTRAKRAELPLNNAMNDLIGERDDLYVELDGYVLAQADRLLKALEATTQRIAEAVKESAKTWPAEEDEDEDEEVDWGEVWYDETDWY